MFHKSTNSWPTARVQIGQTPRLSRGGESNDNLVWNSMLFGRRVRELGVAGAASLLASLLKYLDNIELALGQEALEEAAYDLIRADLLPISGFLGFDGLSAMLSHADMSSRASRHMLRRAVHQVCQQCRIYCDNFL